MELKEALLKRRSVRKFTDEKVSEEDINELLHAAMSGPSACNRQPWDFYVITNEELLKEVKRMSPFIKHKCPLIIVVTGDLRRTLPLSLSDFWVQDCSAATENILLRVTDLGLGAVWCGVYPEMHRAKKLAKLLNLNDKQIPLNIICIGHPDEEAEARDQYEEKYIHYLK